MPKKRTSLTLLAAVALALLAPGCDEPIKKLARALATDPQPDTTPGNKPPSARPTPRPEPEPAPPPAPAPAKKPAPPPAENPAPPEVKVSLGRIEVRGALDKEVIARIIRRHDGELKHCHRQHHQPGATSTGELTIQFTISPKGQVVSSVVQRSTIKSPTSETCMARAVRRCLFPAPAGGGIVIVSATILVQSR